jgi:hypothetical protein
VSENGKFEMSVKDKKGLRNTESGKIVWNIGLSSSVQTNNLVFNFSKNGAF